MAKQDYPYPEDEFDVLGADRVPQGVHRTPTPRWRALLPFVIALVLAPTLAYLGVSYLTNLGTPSSSSSGVSATASPEPSEPAVEETPEPTPEETPEEEPPVEEEPIEEPEEEPEDPDVQRDAPVFVLNGAGVAGLAATAAEALQSDGFTAVTATNYDRSAPSASTVYYNNAELQATAEQVGSVLGIANLVELASATDSIAIVLRSDFQP